MNEAKQQNQVIQSFFSKCAQLIVQSRQVPPPPGPAPKTNKWFNIVSDEVDWVRDDLRQWRSGDPQEMSPLIIETFVSAKAASHRQKMVLVDDGGKSWPTDKPEVVLERWVVEFRPGQGVPTEVSVVYKHAIIAIRVLYSLTRLLPAWNLRRRLVRQKLAASPLKISCRILDGSHPIANSGRTGLSKPIINPNGGDSPLRSHTFSPVETPSGTLHISVSYRKDVSFTTDDVESVISQQFLELDVATSSPPKPERSRPVVSFTRPFRSPETGSVASIASVGSHASSIIPKRTPSTSSVSLAHGNASVGSGPGSMGSAPGVPVNVPGSVPGSVPVPVPSHIAREPGLTSSVSSSSSIPRFSSSFASRISTSNRRSGSLESRHRPQSIVGSVSSTTSSVDPTTGLYMPQTDVGDFVRFVDDTQKRASKAFRGSKASLDSSLARFNTLRASHIQLSDSMAMSTMSRPSIGKASNSSSRRPSGASVGDVSMTHDVPAEQSSNANITTSASPVVSSRGSPVGSPVGSPTGYSQMSISPRTSVGTSAGRATSGPPSSAPHAQSTSPSSGAGPNHSSSVPSQHHIGSASSRYAHMPANPSRLSEEYTVDRSTSGVRSRLGFYSDDLEEKSKERSNPDKSESDDELLFAFSDMQV